MCLRSLDPLDHGTPVQEDYVSYFGDIRVLAAHGCGHAGEGDDVGSGGDPG